MQHHAGIRVLLEHLRGQRPVAAADVEHSQRTALRPGQEGGDSPQQWPPLVVAGHVAVDPVVHIRR
jgi:hypothetical protein